MTKYDVTDTAIINANPKIVYKAVIDGYDGKTKWWMPHLSSKIRNGSSSDKVGSLFDVTIHGIFPIKFTGKTVEVKNNEMIRVNYVEGSFSGEGLWKFEGSDGKTKLSFRWRTNPSGLLLRIVASFYPIEKSHSRVMRAGFDNLNKFLARRLEPSGHAYLFK